MELFKPPDFPTNPAPQGGAENKVKRSHADRVRAPSAVRTPGIDVEQGTGAVGQGGDEAGVLGIPGDALRSPGELPFAEQLARLGVPEFQRLVIRAAQHAPTVRAERARPHIIFMSGECAEFHAGLGWMEQTRTRSASSVAVASQST